MSFHKIRHPTAGGRFGFLIPRHVRPRSTNWVTSPYLQGRKIVRLPTISSSVKRLLTLLVEGFHPLCSPPTCFPIRCGHRRLLRQGKTNFSLSWRSTGGYSDVKTH